MDDKTELHRFAEMLMRWVRDPSIDSCDTLASRRMFGPTGERWRDRLAEPQAREAMSQLIPDIVDEVLFKLLHALDQGDMPLAWASREWDVRGFIRPGPKRNGRLASGDRSRLLAGAVLVETLVVHLETASLRTREGWDGAMSDIAFHDTYIASMPPLAVIVLVLGAVALIKYL